MESRVRQLARLANFFALIFGAEAATAVIWAAWIAK
jgi:hypothetical protein